MRTKKDSSKHRVTRNDKAIFAPNHFSKGFEVSCRVDAYNRTVDKVVELAERLRKSNDFINRVNFNNSDPKIDRLRIREKIEWNGNAIESWNIYEEISSQTYWINLSRYGSLVEGYNNSNEQKIGHRIIDLRHISPEDEVSVCDCCSSDYNLLDFNTLSALADKILQLCIALGLCDSIEAEEIVDHLPPKASEHVYGQASSIAYNGA